MPISKIDFQGYPQLMHLMDISFIFHSRATTDDIQQDFGLKERVHLFTPAALLFVSVHNKSGAMKLHAFLMCIMNYLLLTNQEEQKSEVKQTSWTSPDNNTYVYPDYYGDSTPCESHVPEFNSLALLVIYSIVFVFSLLGNSLVVFVVCSMSKGRASTDIYLMHLALADLLFCFTLPFWAVESHYGWIFGTLPCKFISSFQEASVYCGVFLLACISVDRYFAIVRATRVLSSRHLLVKGICAVVWLVSGFLSVPVAVQREDIILPGLDQPICYENLTGESSDQWRVGLRVLRHTLGFFLPLVVMAFCYGWTVVTLFSMRSQQKHKAMRVILAVVLAFIFCWLPYNVTVLIDTLFRGGSLEETCDVRYIVEALLEVTKIIAFLHCMVNPVLYAFIGEKFRNELLTALYKQGIISKKLWVSYRKGSAASVLSLRSRNTSISV